MKKGFILYSIIISLIATVLMFSLGIFVEMTSNTAQAEDKVIAIANIYADMYTDGGDFVKSDDNVRVTVISADGTVIDDTDNDDVSSMDNHLSRQEVRAALSGKPEAVVRYSDTAGHDMMYYAVKKDIGDTHVFIRAAVSVKSITDYLVKSLPLTVAIMLLAILMSVIVGLFFGDRLLRPLSQVKDSLRAISSGKYVKSIQTGTDSDINKILSEIDDIGEKLEKNVAELKDERSKLDFIINNINDAVIAVDKDKNICLINDVAKDIFDIEGDAVGKSVNMLEYNKQLAGAIDGGATEGHNAVFETKIGTSIYLVTVKTLAGGWTGRGDITAVILSDITASKESEKTRSEFFANAGHELKSPLTAILGFSELSVIENKNDKLDIPLAGIAREAARMLALIEDMLGLSRLESAEPVEKKPVDLRLAAEDVKAGLSGIAADKNVTVSVTGNGTVNADYSHIYSLIKNLLENAVRYNKDGGMAEVSISETSNAVKLKVSDTGIGVESKHQTRIFERFYRVEKSRSRKLGGTGLGLAIVKHICLVYDADIKLQSRVGFGTVVTVSFKK